MVAAVMPKRAAASRSIRMNSARPLFCSSVATSVISGICAMRSIRRGTQTVKSSGLGLSSTNWYWVRLTVESMVRSCDGCM